MTERQDEPAAQKLGLGARLRLHGATRAIETIRVMATGNQAGLALVAPEQVESALKTRLKEAAGRLAVEASGVSVTDRLIASFGREKQRVAKRQKLSAAKSAATMLGGLRRFAWDADVELGYHHLRDSRDPRPFRVTDVLVSYAGEREVGPRATVVVDIHQDNLETSVEEHNPLAEDTPAAMAWARGVAWALANALHARDHSEPATLPFMLPDLAPKTDPT